MAVCGFRLALFTRPVWPIVLFGLGGIGAAVVANAFYDSFANYIEHNLFPFEIVILAFLLMPGLFVGVVTAHIVNQLRKVDK